MTTPPQPDVPRSHLEPLECRQRAEAALRTHNSPAAPTRAVGWALLAVAGELAEIRRTLQRGAR